VKLNNYPKKSWKDHEIWSQAAKTQRCSLGATKYRVTFKYLSNILVILKIVFTYFLHIFFSVNIIICYPHSEGLYPYDLCQKTPAGILNYFLGKTQNSHKTGSILNTGGFDYKRALSIIIFFFLPKNIFFDQSVFFSTHCSP